MTETNAVQVSKEEEMTGMVATMVTFLQDATKLPTLRKELESLRTECESLKREKGDLQAEVSLEREAHAKSLEQGKVWMDKATRLENRLSSLQHKFDTIQGIVAAAMAEARADEPKPAIVNPTEPKPWTPTEPLRSASW